MEKFLVVSEHDKQVLKDQIRVVRNRQLNKLVDEPIRYAKSSDTFVTYIQFSTAGPAGMDLKTTPQSDDEIHSANLDIYKVENMGGGVFNLTKVGSKQTVYNLSRHTLPEGYTLVTRDSFGKWFAVRSDTSLLAQLADTLPMQGMTGATVFKSDAVTLSNEAITVHGTLLTEPMLSGTNVLVEWVGQWEVVNVTNTPVIDVVLGTLNAGLAPGGSATITTMNGTKTVRGSILSGTLMSGTIVIAALIDNQWEVVNANACET